jgi:hypothetical protein
VSKKKRMKKETGKQNQLSCLLSAIISFFGKIKKEKN